MQLLIKEMPPAEGRISRRAGPRRDSFMTTTESSPSGQRTTTDPATRAGDPFAYAGETPHGCYEGWVYLGFEGEDENGEHVEEIERLPCRRCAGDVR